MFAYIKFRPVPPALELRRRILLPIVDLKAARDLILASRVIEPSNLEYFLGSIFEMKFKV